MQELTDMNISFAVEMRYHRLPAHFPDLQAKFDRQLWKFRKFRNVLQNWLFRLLRHFFLSPSNLNFPWLCFTSVEIDILVIFRECAMCEQSVCEGLGECTSNHLLIETCLDFIVEYFRVLLQARALP